MKKTCLGFTLIELLVVISVVGILFTIGVARYQAFNRRQLLVQAAQNLKSNLRLAQDKALAGEKDCLGRLDGFRVSLAADSYSIRSQCDNGFNFGPATSFSFPPGITKTSDTSLIFFKVLAQGVEITGSSEVILSGFGGETESITVTEVGEIR